MGFPSHVCHSDASVLWFRYKSMEFLGALSYTSPWLTGILRKVARRSHWQNLQLADPETASRRLRIVRAHGSSAMRFQHAAKILYKGQATDSGTVSRSMPLIS